MLHSHKKLEISNDFAMSPQRDVVIFYKCVYTRRRIHGYHTKYANSRANDTVGEAKILPSHCNTSFL